MTNSTGREIFRMLLGSCLCVSLRNTVFPWINSLILFIIIIIYYIDLLILIFKISQKFCIPIPDKGDQLDVIYTDFDKAFIMVTILPYYAS